jgi:hypothetical protein
MHSKSEMIKKCILIKIQSGRQKRINVHEVKNRWHDFQNIPPKKLWANIYANLSFSFFHPFLAFKLCKKGF